MPTHTHTQPHDQHLFSRIHPFNLNPNEIFKPFPLPPRPAPPTPHRCRRLPVRAMWKWRHLHRQDWFIPLPLPAQLRRRHMRERWEWEDCTQTRGWWTQRCYESCKLFWKVCGADKPSVCATTVGSLCKISSHLTLGANSLLKTAAGNNPDQDMASVTAVCHDTISQRQISAAITMYLWGAAGLEGDRYPLKLLQARRYTHCFSSVGFLLHGFQSTSCARAFVLCPHGGWMKNPLLLDVSGMFLWWEIIALTVLCSAMYAI